MAWDKEWTEGSYTKEDVRKLGEALVKVIKNNEGEYTGKLIEIAKLAGYPTTEDNELENYGGIYKAMQVVKEQYGIISKNKGRKGNNYSFKNEIECTDKKEKEMTGTSREREIITTLKNIMNLIDLDRMTGEEAKGVLRSIKTILK